MAVKRYAYDATLVPQCLNRDIGLQASSQLLLNAPYRRVGTRRKLFMRLRRRPCLASTGSGKRARAGLHVADRELTRNNLVRELELSLLIFHREKRSRMTGRDVSAFHHLPNSRGQRQYPEQICDGRAIFAHGISDLLLGQLKLVDETLVALCLLERIQVGTLKILDECQGEHGAIVEIPNNGGDFSPPQAACRAEPPLAGNEFPPIPLARSYGDGLKQPAGADRCLELSQFGLREHSSRLKTVWRNIRNPNSLKLRARPYSCARCGRLGSALGPGRRDERLETSAQAARRIGAHADASCEEMMETPVPTPPSGIG